jgi:hypothetical protein
MMLINQLHGRVLDKEYIIPRKGGKRKMNYIKQFNLIIFLMIFLWPMGTSAENIDPDNDDSQYAYGENIGWLNAEPSGDGGPGVEVSDTNLTGYIWAENIGWVNLSCENTSSCSSVDFGVINDGLGNLSGYAWAENVGWLSFSCENTSSCDAVDYGVMIDPLLGDFSGHAWGENIGWVTFSATTPVSFGVVTSWIASIYLCQCDLEPEGGDNDVDGADLAAYIADRGGITVAEFAGEYGRTDCP